MRIQGEDRGDISPHQESFTSKGMREEYNVKKIYRHFIGAYTVCILNEIKNQLPKLNVV